MHKGDLKVLGYLDLKYSTLMLIASLLANGLNYLFNLSMNRLLAPEQYGALSSLLGLFMILAIPATSARLVAARYISQFRTEEHWGDANAFFEGVLKYMGGYGLILFTGLSLLANAGADFLNLPSPWSIIVLGAALLPSVLVPVAQAGLQGLQRFGALSVNMVLSTGSRLLLGLSFVWLGWGVNGALAASTFSGIMAFVCAAWMLRALWAGHQQKQTLPGLGIWQYANAAFWGILAFTVLTNVDVVLVKHFFQPDEAGFYSTAATLGRIILYFPVAISTVMFPQAVENHTRQKDSSYLGRESLLVTVFLCLPLVLLYFLLSTPLVCLLFGNRYLVSAPLIGPVGLAMSFFAVIGLLLQYYLSIDNYRFVIVVMLGAISLVIGICVFHSNLKQILFVLNAVGIVTLLVGEGWCRGVVG